MFASGKIIACLRTDGYSRGKIYGIVRVSRPIEKAASNDRESGQYDELRYTHARYPRFVAAFRTVVSIDVIKSEIRIWCKITYGTYGLQIEMNILCDACAGYVHGDFLGYLEDPSFLADRQGCNNF